MPRLSSGIVLFVFTLGTWAAPAAQKDISPAQYKVLVAMAQCKTLLCLNEQRKRTPKDDAIANLVFFSKHMQIHPTRDSAAGVLQAIPTDEAAQTSFITFTTDWQEGRTESIQEMEILGQVYFDWPKVVGRAALMRPDMMSYYVQFLRLATNDVHTDFTGNAEQVCKKHYVAFNKAFRDLPEGDLRFIRQQVFDPSSCSAIFRSEAD